MKVKKMKAVLTMICHQFGTKQSRFTSANYNIQSINIQALLFSTSHAVGVPHASCLRTKKSIISVFLVAKHGSYGQICSAQTLVDKVS